MFDFYRVATAVPDMKVCDVSYNVSKIIEKIKEAADKKANFIVFPELSLTGYSCADLFFQETLLSNVKLGMDKIIEETKKINMTIIVGIPCLIDYQLFNLAVVLYKGEVVGATVKTFIPNYNEFYERRWFSTADDLDIDMLNVSAFSNPDEDYFVPIGNDLVYKTGNVSFGIEICEDLWSPITPGTWQAMAGAEIIFNLSASNETIGKRVYRENLVKSKSASLLCEYVYVSAGNNESTTDLVFSGHSIIAENNRIIAENDGIAENDYLLCMDIDIGKIKADRLKGKSFKDAYSFFGKLKEMRTLDIRVSKGFGSDGTLYKVATHPFIPSSEKKRLERCSDIFKMQVGGLKKRLSITGGKLVVGVSGGMDSTLALLVGAQTMKSMGLPMSNMVGITMPAFGTTDRTYNNSLELMKKLGITVKTIPIKDACIQHYKDIEHDYEIKDITFENVQARERTQVLMDYANKIGAIVLGTGDLSELALGWCTYNADQMSMYGVNASIPKTLVRWMIDSVIFHEIFPECTEVLKDIIDTPISPELLPPDENGNIVQKTEEKVGPYELHDFYLYYMMRYGYTPSKIYMLAKRAFDGIYDDETIKKWMITFYRRFFSQQFKRSCMPDGVKVGSVCLSPRGDWRMPSDASASLWIKEAENL